VIAILKGLGQLAMYFEVHDSKPEIVSLFADLEDGGEEEEPSEPEVKKGKKKPTGRKAKRGDSNA
jgi:hypothetical protein